ncbi:hypothetical protein, conserved [Trypanosoma brucei brucei TREU927]|uniref:RTR1-type domain-containing protein n=1 Tax=Trypanosoma brucei brucei (strain 927/4 GUTat10.1) TaxID=185431 RepID=Q38C26_TRYB2|nr:hypothetical protein, conserved [Trypanosoma brucei brucei TREU927]EAN77644.1 hypothetical protein, conserved [Trypanosoma brucei brucei TREU927]
MSCGGAWEALIDRAAMEVSKFLSATKDAFHQDSPTAEWMLNLLDDNALRDVVMERNFNALCGMVGCAAMPPAAVGRVEGQLRQEAIGTGKNILNRNDEEDTVSDGEDDGGDAADAFRRYEKYREQICAGREAATALSGVDMTKCFCSPDCAEQFAAMLAKVPRTLVYSREGLVNSVGGLFPNMQFSVLQQLAGAEATVVPDIREKEVVEGQEKKLDLPIPSIGNEENKDHKVKLRELLESIQAVQPVWSRGVQEVRPFDTRKGTMQKMPIPLMVYDWLGTVSTDKTKSIFASVCYSNTRKSDRFPCVGGGRSTNLFVRCMQPVLDACIRKGKELSEGRAADEGCAENPCVDPALQHQRLTLFVRHVFSGETSATLSRLLMYDQATLERAWGAWNSTGLLASLSFPSAVPGDFTCGGGSPARIYLAVVLTAAAALCAPAIWVEWLQEDNGLAEVLEALGCTSDDFIACVRALVVE